MNLFMLDFSRKIQNFHFSVIFDEFVYFWNFPGKFRAFKMFQFFIYLVNLFIFGIFPENSES